MKTGITLINTVQVGMDAYRDIRITKVFNDAATIGEIKDWIVLESKHKLDRDAIGLS